MYHIIRLTLRARIDDRDKIETFGPNPETETACGLFIPLHDRERIRRLNGQSADALCCNECLASLMLIGD